MTVETIISGGKEYHAFNYEHGTQFIVDGVHYIVVYAYGKGKAFMKVG